MKNPNTIVAGHLELKGRFESACRVFDTEGVAPTQNTAQGGGMKHISLNMNYAFLQYGRGTNPGGGTPSGFLPDNINKFVAE